LNDVEAPMADKKNESHWMHLILLILGGLCLGTGIIFLYGSFGWTGGDFNSNLKTIGFSALDNISLLPDSHVSIPLIGIGTLCLVFANATAWRATDGY
jgi:hypothetical protein